VTGERAEQLDVPLRVVDPLPVELAAQTTENRPLASMSAE
jgi:hypothetical protein